MHKKKNNISFIWLIPNTSAVIFEEAMSLAKKELFLRPLQKIRSYDLTEIWDKWGM